MTGLVSIRAKLQKLVTALNKSYSTTNSCAIDHFTMQGTPLYSNMSDEENSDERFSDELARSGAQPTRSHYRSSDGGGTTSEEDTDARRSKRKSKRKSKRPSSSENMTEEELMAASARRKRRESRKAAASGVVAPEGRTSSRELEDPRESRRSSRHSGSRSTESTGLEGGIDRAVDLGDEEDPFARSAAPPQDRSRYAPKPTTSTKKKQEINKDFKDLRETGRWGSISKKEKWIVGIVALLVIIGVIVAVAILATRGGDEAPASLATSPPAPTAAPTARIVLSAQEQLSAIRAATVDNPATEASSLALLPEDVSFYQGKADDPTAAPVVRAASWIMYDDPIDNEEWLIPRYGLAVLYYATNGSGWTDQTGWMTESSACEWLGIRCDRFNKAIEEIDLSGNNLVGSIPNEVSMVNSLISLWLRKNELSGTVPNVALGSIPLLSILYLDGNKLGGSITSELAASGSLSKYIVEALKCNFVLLLRRVYSHTLAVSSF